ncbi:uncharacterized protein LOC111707867 [Eurytemora carolleeae]|uniref:uncharacterized protein LOC111707867 n=1 Tax=Eurytemora carolleeae TaxID=1294199 RepID=UPI000C76317A|nr:uncharacterized protein LOC111707867 [Eurytemora carolleeae]|eukprot:XP_023336819.1 uncharacterized protein LOC111707867 [Eurytemora affinis]
MIPSGTAYSTFYLFAEQFGLKYTMREEYRCNVTNETLFTGGCKHLIDDEIFAFIHCSNNYMFYGPNNTVLFNKVNLLPIYDSGTTLICPLPVKKTNFFQIIQPFSFEMHISYHYKLEENFYIDVINGLKKQGRYVIRNELEKADFITKRGDCVAVDLNTMRHLITQQQLKEGKVTVSLSTFDDGGIFVPKIINGWLYKREGEYLETIQRFITQLWDSGLMIHILRIHYGRALKVTETESEPEPLYMESLYLCFIIYFFGLLLGKVVFIQKNMLLLH